MTSTLCLGSAIAVTAWADPPGRVGRLGETAGQVWRYAPDAGEWVTAERNRPLTTGDRLATDAGARAELRIGTSTVRMDSASELELVELSDDHLRLQLHNGSIGARLISAEAAREFELRTPEGRFLANRPGRYRFDRSEASIGVTAWSGEAVYQGLTSGLTVYAGQRAEFWLDRNSVAQYRVAEPVRDRFASWSDEADRRDDRIASSRYVSPEMTGAEDLDRYGRWSDAPGYGAVWVPQQVPTGWAPYSAGHWAWVEPWGWTWVDDAPWGFAPFHYGRWVMLASGWAWVPGSYVHRPVYAPALVAWVGGPQVAFSLRIGGGPAPAVGWFPLAPREVYVPTYRASPRYVQQVNITHVTNITNITTIVNNPQQAVSGIDYANRRHPNAVTVVPQAAFLARQPVTPAAAQFRNTAAAQQAMNPSTQQVVAAAPPMPAALPEAHRVGVMGPITSGAAQSHAPGAQRVPPPPGQAPNPAAAPPPETPLRADTAQPPQRLYPSREEPRAQPAPALPSPPATPGARALRETASTAAPLAAAPARASTEPMAVLPQAAVVPRGEVPRPPASVTPPSHAEAGRGPLAAPPASRTIPLPPNQPQAAAAFNRALASVAPPVGPATAQAPAGAAIGPERVAPPKAQAAAVAAQRDDVPLQPRGVRAHDEASARAPHRSAHPDEPKPAPARPQPEQPRPAAAPNEPKTPQPQAQSHPQGRSESHSSRQHAVEQAQPHRSQ